jgi:hypothetical protein
MRCKNLTSTSVLCVLRGETPLTPLFRLRNTIDISLFSISFLWERPGPPFWANYANIVQTLIYGPF